MLRTSKFPPCDGRSFFQGGVPDEGGGVVFQRRICFERTLRTFHHPVKIRLRQNFATERRSTKNHRKTWTAF
jgi:hypothetical protein